MPPSPWHVIGYSRTSPCLVAAPSAVLSPAFMRTSLGRPSAIASADSCLTTGCTHPPPIHPSIEPSSWTIAFAPGRTLCGG
jgi:hypothetical protein